MIGDQSAVGSTNSYNLYSAGATAKNYFAGLVGIGTDTTPDAVLEVEKNTALTTDLVHISQNTAGTVTDAIDGMQIDFLTAAVAGNRDNAGIRLSFDPTGATEAGDTFEGLVLNTASNPTGVGTAIQIGSNWDNFLDTASIDITGAGVMSGLTGLTVASGTVSFPNDQIGPDEIFATGQADGECLKYVAAGDTVAWDTCGAGGSTLQQAYEAGETIAVDTTNGAMVFDLVSANFDIKSGEGTDTGDFRVWDGTANWILVDESADTLALGAAAGGGIAIDGGTGAIDIGTSANAKTITIGSTTGATAINLDAGTGLIDIDSTRTSGILTQIGASEALSISGALTGLSLDLATNYTTDDEDVTGINIALDAITPTSAGATLKGLYIAGGTLVGNTFGNPTYIGADILNPATDGTAGDAFATAINLTLGSITGTGEQYGIVINPSSSNTSGNLVGMFIQGITPGAAAENAIQIGNGWDSQILFNDTTTQLKIVDTGTFTFEDFTGNDLLTITDATNVGNVTATGDLTVSGGEIYVAPQASSASTTEGTIYYDSDNDNLYVYANGGFVDLTVQGGGSSVWSDLTVPTADLTLAMDADNTTFTWDPTADSAETAFVMNFDGEDATGVTDENQYLLSLVQTANGTDVSEAADALILLTNNDTNDPVNAAIALGAGAAGGFDYGIDLSAATINTADLKLENDETIANGTDDYIDFTGVAGGDNTDLRIDLDGTYPIFSSQTDTVVGILDELRILDSNATNYLSLAHDGTDANITTNSGNINIGTGGGDLILGVNNTTAVGILFDESDQIYATAGETITVTDLNTITPDAADTYNLGSTALEWNQAFLGDNAGVNLGVDDNWTVLYDEATDDRLEFVSSGAISGDNNVYFDLVDSAANSTFTITNSNGSFVADLAVEGDLTVSGGDLYITPQASSASTTEGTLYYDSDDDNLYVYANGGFVDLTVQGGAAALDTLSAATTNSTALDSNANTITWNWDFTTAAVDSGLIISESSASTTGGQDQQALLELITLSTSTASPLQVTAGGADVADIWFNLASDADFQIRDGGTTVFEINQDGLATFSDDVTYTFAAAENFEITNTTATADVLSLTATGDGNGIDGVSIAFTQPDNAGAGDTNAAVNISVTSSEPNVEEVLYGININTLTPGSAAETALNIGSGWDRGLTIADAGTNSVLLSSTDGDGASGITFGSATPAYVYRSAAGELSISDSATAGSGNYFQFDTANGPTYGGNARPHRKVTLTPEYAGAVLTGSGTGTMTSDFCEQGVSADITDTNTTFCESGQIHNYYNWTAASGSQTYSVYIRWRIPDNFAAWDTDPVQIYGRVSDSTDGSVTATVFGTGGGVENSGGTAIDGTSATWTQTTVEALPLEGTYTAGGYMTIKIDLQVTGTDTAQVGEINLNYLSNN
jgi:hypothetical protein